MRTETTLANLFHSAGLRDESTHPVGLALLQSAGIREIRPGRIASTDRARALELLRAGIVRSCSDPGCQAAPLPEGRWRIAVGTAECELCLGGSSRRAVEILTAISNRTVPTLDLDEPALLATVAAELGGEELALGELARRLRGHGVDVRAAGLRRLSEQTGAFRLRGERIRRNDEVALSEALERLAGATVHPLPDAPSEPLDVTIPDPEPATPPSPEPPAADPTPEPPAPAPAAPDLAAPAAPSRRPLDLQGVENERIGRFAALFGSIESALRERQQVGDELRLGDLVRAAAERDPLVRSWSGVLLDAVRFRNPLMHRSVRGRPLAVPTEEFLSELALAARSLTGEARLIDLVERPSRVAPPTAPALLVEQLAGSGSALVESGGETHLVTEASFGRWVAGESLAHPGRPVLHAVSDSLALARLAGAHWVEVDVTLRPAALLLALRSTPVPDAALLRRPEPGSPVVGVALAADLPRLLRAIGDDPVGPREDRGAGDDEDEG